MKKKQSATGLFFSMFLRAIVVILAIVIVCLGVALVRSLIHNKGKDAGTTSTPASQSVTENQVDPLITAAKTEATTETPQPSAADLAAKIVVLNGTSTNGVAGAWKEKLNNAGYTSVEAANYKGNTQKSLIYYKTQGKGAELASYLKDPQTLDNFEASNTDADLSEVDVVIVIGADDDIVSNPPADNPTE
ncbi:MAG: LytR C-terminal domain-containing protein [Eubacterium sp.]|nr:LytR C-terminal domain-containing protein [Eubacterium sp.]